MLLNYFRTRQKKKGTKALLLQFAVHTRFRLPRVILDTPALDADDVVVVNLRHALSDVIHEERHGDRIGLDTVGEQWISFSGSITGKRQRSIPLRVEEIFQRKISGLWCLAGCNNTCHDN